MKRKGAKFVVLLLPAFVFLMGCKVFLPAHPNSHALSEEKVCLRLITFEQATNEYSRIAWQNPTNDSRSFEYLYTNAFPGKKLEPVRLPNRRYGPKPLAIAAAPIAAAVVGYAVDYAKKQLEQEATLYQAQFESNVSDDSFWKISGTNYYVQNYCGFELIRSVKDQTNAFRLICGISASSDGQFFRIAPLFEQTTKSKAKVLSDSWIAYITSFFSTSRTPSYEVDTTVDIECDGYWMDKDNNSKFAKLAAFPLKFNRVNLNTLTPFLSSDKTNEARSMTSGWLVSIPASQNTVDKDGNDTSSALGVFTLSARVTEVDTSNTKELLQQAAKVVGDNQTKIIAVVTNAIPSRSNE